MEIRESIIHVIKAVMLLFMAICFAFIYDKIGKGKVLFGPQSRDS